MTYRRRWDCNQSSPKSGLLSQANIDSTSSRNGQGRSKSRTSPSSSRLEVGMSPADWKTLLITSSVVRPASSQEALVPWWVACPNGPWPPSWGAVVWNSRGGSGCSWKSGCSGMPGLPTAIWFSAAGIGSALSSAVALVSAGLRFAAGSGASIETARFLPDSAACWSAGVSTSAVPGWPPSVGVSVALEAFGTGLRSMTLRRCLWTAASKDTSVRWPSWFQWQQEITSADMRDFWVSFQWR